MTAPAWLQTDWSVAQATARRHRATAIEQAAAQRAWLEARPARWLRTYLPEVFAAPYAPGTPRRALIDALTAMPPAVEGRPPFRLLAEMGRGLGKTQTLRGFVLLRLLSGADDAAVLVSQREDDATAALRWIMGLGIPPRRDAEKPSDPQVRAWRRSPLGLGYPGLRYEGGTSYLILHRDGGRPAHLWARGAGATIRGLSPDGVRPTLVGVDDVVSSATGWSEALTQRRLALIGDELAGLGYASPPIPAALVVIGNPLHPSDLYTRLTAVGWPTLTGSVWSDPDGRPALGLPLTAPLSDLLAALRRTRDAEERLALAVEALAAAPALLSGHRPSDPSHAPALLLAWQAEYGDRAFGRLFCGSRYTADTALWPWARVRRVESVARSEVGSVGVWMDPRYSQAAARNDFAAVAAVARLRSGQRVVLAVEEGRTTIEGARRLYWSLLDRVGALLPGVSVSAAVEDSGGVGPYLLRDLTTDARGRAAGRLATLPDLVPASRAQGKDSGRLDRLTGDIDMGRLAVLAGALSEEGERQCGRLGTGYHDDVPDAIERADALAAPVARSPLLDWMRHG